MSCGSLAVCLLITATTAVLSERNKTRWLVHTGPQRLTTSTIGKSSLMEICLESQEEGNWPCNHEAPTTAPYAKPLASVVRRNTSDDILVVDKKDNWPLKECRNSSQADMSLRASTVMRMRWLALVLPLVRSMRRRRFMSFWRSDATLSGGKASVWFTVSTSMPWSVTVVEGNTGLDCLMETRQVFDSLCQLRCHGVLLLLKGTLF